jgi:malate dehydrogenase (oxaloacetate-decarboxylating)(NADP+)
MAIVIRKEDALNYHSLGQPGKIEVVPTKMLSSQQDLALAYSPGVAEPCKEIAQNVENVYKYTAKGNLVAVITNGTAVLGLGNIGPEASKPVMEGKGVLFKKFAGIDVFDIEINEMDPEKFVQIVKSLEPTFGGINLEDIKAPECFYIEEELRKRMDIPVMHDDQHGTAIISSAALLNALEVSGKKIEEIKLVVSGAGAAAMACVKLYLALGLQKHNLVMYDKDGIIRQDRPNLHPSHFAIATDQPFYTLAEALVGADVFLGLSVGGILTPEMVNTMAPTPIVFALANPNPEIEYDTAMACRPDIIMATGRSDHPNQVNNVLGFPYIFRGAMDVRATEINEEMKLAAVRAIAQLAKEPVPDIVNKAYGDDKIVFGKEYLIPKPLDPRLIFTISPAVAKAAMASGVAKFIIYDWEWYNNQLMQRVGMDQKLMTRLMNKARQNTKRIVFAEADKFKILKAAQIIEDEGLGIPILLGNKEKIQSIIKEYKLDLRKSIIVDHLADPEKLHRFAENLYEKRKRKGLTLDDAFRMMHERNYFGTMLLEMGEADAFISGSTKDYAKAILPALHVIGVAPGVNKVAGLYIVNNKKGPYFFADTTVNIDPTADELTEIIGLAAGFVKELDIQPRVAVLSYSNFGSAKGKIPTKAMLAAQKANMLYPDLMIEGDIQADVALRPKLQQEVYPFSELAAEGANTLIFPDLASGNIAYKLLHEIGGCEVIGPILLGMAKPVHILQLGSSVRDIVNMATIALVEAQ